MDIGAFGNVNGKHSKGKHGKSRSKQGQQDKDKERTREPVECENCGEPNHYAKDCWNKKDQTNKDGSKGKNKHKNAMDAHNPGSKNNESEVEIGGFETNFFNVDVWKCACLNSSRLESTFRTTTGELVKSGKRLCAEVCLRRCPTTCVQFLVA